MGRYHGITANSANVEFGKACKPSEENTGEGTEYGDFWWALVNLEKFSKAIHTYG